MNSKHPIKILLALLLILFHSIMGIGIKIFNPPPTQVQAIKPFIDPWLIGSALGDFATVVATILAIHDWIIKKYFDKRKDLELFEFEELESKKKDDLLSSFHEIPFLLSNKEKEQRLSVIKSVLEFMPLIPIDERLQKSQDIYYQILHAEKLIPINIVPDKSTLELLVNSFSNIKFLSEKYISTNEETDSDDKYANMGLLRLKICRELNKTKNIWSELNLTYFHNQWTKYFCGPDNQILISEKEPWPQETITIDLDKSPIVKEKNKYH